MVSRVQGVLSGETLHTGQHVGSVVSLDCDDLLLLSAGGFNRAEDNQFVRSIDETLRLWDLRAFGAGRPPLRIIHVQRTEHFEVSAHVMQRGAPVLSARLFGARIISTHGDGTVRCWSLHDPHCSSD